MNHPSTRSSPSVGRKPRFGLIAVLIAGVLLFPLQAPDQGLFFRPAMQSVNLSIEAAQEIVALEPGQTVERELAGGETHSYQITLEAGQYLHAIVEQRSVDLMATLFGPSGQPLNQYDSRWHGPEPVSLIADAGGIYRLEVRTLQPKAERGQYAVRIEQLRSSAPADQKQVAAERASTEAKQLLAQVNLQSLLRAREKYEAALPLWRAAGDRYGEAQTLNSIGYTYNALGDARKALDYFDRALALRREINDLSGEGETLGNIAAAHSASDKKLDYYNKALPIKRATGDRAGEASTLANIGAVHHSLGDSPKALDHLERSLPLWRAAGDDQGKVQAHIGLGAASSAIGEPQQALDHFGQALALSRSLGNRRTEAYALLNTGKVYDDLGESRQSLDYFEKALTGLREIRDRRAEAITLQNIGALFARQGEHQKALEYYNRALPIWRSLLDSYGEAYTLGNLGRAYDGLGQKQQALAHYDRALALHRGVKNRSGEAATINNIGVVHDSLGEYQKALDLYGQSLRLFREAGDRNGEAVNLYSIARVERDRGNLTEARAQIEAALKITDSLRTRVAVRELRTSYFASVQGYYEFYIDLLMRLDRNRPSEGFAAMAIEASERARARSLLDLLAEMRAEIRQDGDPGLVDRERVLRQQLNAKAEYQFRLLGGKHTEEQAEAVRKELDEILEALRKVEAQIRQTSPRYAALKYTEPISLTEIQQHLLDDDTLLLEYALGEERSYLWVVTPSSIDGFELPKRREIEAVARSAYGLLATRNLPIRNETATQEIPHSEITIQLSRMLLGPIAARLGKKRLLIVADGVLQYLPFSALPEPGKDSAPLIAEHEIISLPSASTLSVLRREVSGRASAPKFAAVFADPIFQPDDVRIRKRTGKKATPTGLASDWSNNNQEMARPAQEAGAIITQQRLERLLFSRREADEIIAIASAKTSFKALDFAANRATVLNSDLGQYRIVHFATHGLLDSMHPELSGVVLSLFDEQGRPQDGFLRLHDIYNLRLTADLVVLSACKTGLGKEIKGEGLIGLTRGFMYAGAPRVVASLWQVDDRATAELMKHFYHRMLSDNLPPAAALRAAQVTMWRQKRWAAPHYWSGFVLQGEWK